MLSINNINNTNNTNILLRPNPNRFVIHPIQHPEIYELYEKHRKAYWTEHEIDLSNDLNDFNLLSQNERIFVENVLAFFAGSDGIVSENLASRFMNEIQIPEARFFYSFQIFMENVHSATYAKLLDTYVTDEERKRHLFNAIHTIPTVQKKAEWALKWLESDAPFELRLLAFICVEGICFSGSFCCIYWLRQRGILPGLCQSNNLIARDESLHTDFGILLYNMYCPKLDVSIVHELFDDIVKIELEYTIDSIKENLRGMNSDDMCEYIKYVSNRLLTMLNYPILYQGAKQPFPFMDRVNFDSKASFFDRKSSEYISQTGGDLTSFDFENEDF